MIYIEGTFDKHKRGDFIKKGEIPKFISIAQEEGYEFYTSWYEFDEEILRHTESHKTIRNYGGMIYPPAFLKLDIDKGKDTNEFVLHRARMFYESLFEWGLSEDSIGIFFSGTGYHFYIPDIFGFEPSTKLNRIVKNTLSHYFPEADDIYDKTRLFRVVNTLNHKSNLYKIQLSFEEFTSLNYREIHKLAKEPRDILPIELENVGKHKDMIIHDQGSSDRISGNFTNVVTCMQHLYRRGPIKGRRHTDLLRLVSAWRRQGLSKEACIDLATRWASTMEPMEVEKVVSDIFDKGYTYGCGDSVYQEFCDERCMFFKHKNYEPETLEAGNIEKKFADFVNTDMEERILNIRDIYPGIDFKFYPGELVIITGDSGAGKSAWAQNLNIGWKIPTLYLSLEMHDLLVYRRFIQIAHNMTRDEVEDYYRQPNFKSLTDEIEHIKVLTTSPTLNNIERLINQTMPRLVIVDVIDGIIVKGKDENGKISEITNYLKMLADKLGIIIIAIHHINKSAAVEGKITMHSLKGASTVYQKADKVLGVLGNKESKFRKITTLKARDESPITVHLEWDVSTFRFYQIGE